MQNSDQKQHLVAVIGAGPAGLFAAKELASAGKRVVLFNRDIKPGGLAEYGIFPTKYKMKEGLRKQFHQILENPLIEYMGNVSIGLHGDLSLNDLRAFGFQVGLVSVGAQATKWLGLPGEDLVGVYHAKDIVYHYNRLPPFSEKKFTIGHKAAIIGAGNVMMDIAHWLVRHKQIDEVIAVVRRGPAEVKFTKKELETVAANLDIQALDAEIARVTPSMQAVGQDGEAAKGFILSGLAKAEPQISNTRLRFEFLSSPARIIGNEEGLVRGLEVEDTFLVKDESGDTSARRTGTHRIIPCDTVIFCIGDRVDEDFGLPVRRNEFVKNPNPRFPINGVSFEAYDPNMDQPLERIFVAGWSRQASSGLVGVARKDGESGAQAILQYLQNVQPLVNTQVVIDRVWRHLAGLGKVVVTKHSLNKLIEYECLEAQRQGLDDFKCTNNEEMLDKMELR